MFQWLKQKLGLKKKFLSEAEEDAQQAQQYRESISKTNKENAKEAKKIFHEKKKKNINKALKEHKIIEAFKAFIKPYNKEAEINSTHKHNSNRIKQIELDRGQSF